MASFDHIGGAEPSTLTFKLATVTQTRNSSKMHQEVQTIGDPESSLGLAAVLGAAPASTTFGLVVRRVGDSTSIIHGDSTVFQGGGAWDIKGNSTVAPLAGSAWVVRSSKADALVSVYQSTASDLQATVTPASSAWQVQISNGNSSVTITAIAAGAGRLNIGSTAADNAVLVSGNSTVAPLAGSLWTIQGNSTVVQAAGSTWNVRAQNSSAADMQVTATQSAAVWTFNIGTHLQSTVAPSSNSSGLVVRQVIDNILTTASTSAFAASTALSIQSSGAGLRSYVVGYSITSTVQAVTKVSFYSSGNMLWPVAMAALSSAFAGVNLAVGAPAYIFRTNSAEALTLNTGNSTIGGFKVGVSYFRAP